MAEKEWVTSEAFGQIWGPFKAPVNATDAEVKALAEAFARPKLIRQRARESSMSPADAYSTRALQGISLGLTDEAEGAVAGIKSLTRGEGFSQANRAMTDELARARGRIDLARQQTGGLGTAAEIAAGVLSGGALVTGGKKIKDLYTASKRSAALGGAYGGVAGLGYGEGTRGKLAGMGAGVLTGGVLGFAVPSAVTAAVGAYRFTTQAAGVGGQKQAMQKVLKAFEADGFTIPEAIQKLNRWQREGAKPEGLFDLGGDEVFGLGEMIIQRPGGGRKFARPFLKERQRKQATRMVQDAAKKLGTDANYRDTMVEIAARQRRIADPLYDEFYAMDIDMTPMLRMILQRPAGIEAYARAQKIAANDGNPMPNLGEGLDIKPSAREWQYIKRGFDDSITTHIDDFGRMTTEPELGQSILKMQKALLAELDRVSGGVYKQARYAWAGEERAKQLMRMGRAIFKGQDDVFDVEDRLNDVLKRADASPGDIANFRVGVLRGIENMASNELDRSSTAVRKMAESPRFRQLLALAFDSLEEADAFHRLMMRELTMAERGSAALGNSRTAFRLAQQAEDKSGQASIEALADIGAGGMFGAAKRALRRGFERGMAENPRTDRAIGEMLFTDQGVRQKLEGLAAAQARNQASQQRTMTGRSRMGGRVMYPFNPVLQGAVQDEVRREEEVRRRGN